MGTGAFASRCAIRSRADHFHPTAPYVHVLFSSRHAICSRADHFHPVLRSSVKHAHTQIHETDAT